MANVKMIRLPFVVILLREEFPHSPRLLFLQSKTSNGRHSVSVRSSSFLSVSFLREAFQLRWGVFCKSSNVLWSEVVANIDYSFLNLLRRHISFFFHSLLLICDCCSVSEMVNSIASLSYRHCSTLSIPEHI